MSDASEGVSDISKYWYSRYRYRRMFKLSSAEMDAEPVEEYQLNVLMASLEAKREQREQKRTGQQISSGH